MTDRSELASSRRRVRQVYTLTLLFAFSLFLFHTILLFDIAAVMVHAETWLTELLGKHRYGKAIILGCFCLLFAGHVAEAAAWALFLRWQRLVPTVSDGLYFAAVTITTLGYGDVVLPRPWRHIRSPDRDRGGAEVRLLDGVALRSHAGGMDEAPLIIPSPPSRSQPRDLGDCRC